MKWLSPTLKCFDSHHPLSYKIQSVGQLIIFEVGFERRRYEVQCQSHLKMYFKRITPASHETGAESGSKTIFVSFWRKKLVFHAMGNESFYVLTA